jgi:hypothetical protein
LKALKLEIERLRADEARHLQERNEWNHKLNELEQLRADVRQMRANDERHQQERRQWEAQLRGKK